MAGSQERDDDDLVGVTLPRLHRRPDLHIDAGDGWAEVWAPSTPRAGLWDVLVQPDDDDGPTEVVWHRAADGPSHYACATCGTRTATRDACRHTRAATLAAELYLTRKETRS